MKILNAVLFKANWLACVIGGALWGVLGVAALIVFSITVRTWHRDAALLVLLAGIGAVLDSLWIQLGILDYGTRLAPLWIIMLWMGLAMTLHHAMSMFQTRPLLGAVLAGGAAPMTYLTGESLGAVSVANPWLLSIIAVAWAGLFYVLFRRLASSDVENAERLPEPTLDYAVHGLRRVVGLR